MDPYSTTLIIRAAGEVAATLVSLLRSSGREEQAEAIEQILKRSDARWEKILDRARME